MTTTSEPGQALPFISFAKGKGFYLSKEAEDFLSSLKNEQVGVISITGKYRTGKSFFINRVLLNTTKNGFNVGPTVNPCTKGLWLWNKTLKSENPEYPDMKVLLVDTEGFAGLDENTNHDTRIFIFSLLLSSFFIYNSTGNIDESALNNLSLIINLAKEIQMKSGGGADTSEDSEEVAQYFPAFLWVVRDFALKLIDNNGHPISSKEYLENALKPQKGVSDLVESKNRIRRMLKHFFRERDCCTMVRPIESEKDLQNLDQLADRYLRPEFLEQMNGVRKRIFKKVKPKTLNGQCLNGGMLLEITKAYIEAINTGNVPNIENAWTYLCKQESQKAMEESINLVEQKLSPQNFKEAIDENELKDMEIQLRDEMLESFKKKSIGDSEETKALHQEVEKLFQERFNKFKAQNTEKWKETFTNWLSTNSDLEARLKDQQFGNFYEFKNELEKIKAVYDKDAPKGTSKELVWGEYSQKLFALAAETISKKIEEQYTLQHSRMSQMLEMTEKELQTKRKDYETERNTLYERIQEIERERAYYKANENSVNERIDHLKKDKEKYERLYNELMEGSKQREERITKEGKDRTSELEQKLETVRNEALVKITELEKKTALLEQESQFIKRENESYKQKVDSFAQEKEQLSANLKQRDEAIEEYKRKLIDLERSKADEVALLRQQLSRQSTEIEEGKKKESGKAQSEWVLEKSYLESQVSFLKSQLDENKRLHDALLMALEQGLNKDDNDGANELVETNRNLSAAVDRMEARCKVLEEKNEKLKSYKKMVKNCLGLQCVHCSKVVPTNGFLQHSTTCVNPQLATLNKQHIITPLASTGQWNQSQSDIDPNALQISINQTMVKENSDSKPYTEYLIQVMYNGMKWAVSRKYKGFCELHQALNTQFPSLKFPESAFTLLGAFNNVNYISSSKRPTVIEERRKALQQYLRDLGKMDVVRNSNVFKKFLELEKLQEREADYNQNMRTGNQPAGHMTSYREDKILSNVTSDRNSNLRDGDHNRNYSPYNQSIRYADNSTMQKEGDVKVDKSMFSQSPQSFMKNWQEKALNKENKLPIGSRTTIDATNAKAQKMQLEESEIEKVDDISSFSLRSHQENPSADTSHDKSLSQNTKDTTAYSQASSLYQTNKPPQNPLRTNYSSGRNSANLAEALANQGASTKYYSGRSSHQQVYQ